MNPAHQRLDSDDHAGRERDARLVVQHELLVRQGAMKLDLEVLARLERRAHLGIEHLEPVALLRLAGIEGKIRVLQQFLGLGPVGGIDRDADGRAGAHLVIADTIGLGQCIDDFLGQDHGALGRVELGLDHRELVAAEPGHGVGLAHHPLEVLGDGLEQLVADRVPEGIVDLLEAVEVHEVNREEFLVALGLGDRRHQAVPEQGAVGKIGQRVVVGQIVDPPLGFLAVGDIQHDAVPHHVAVLDPPRLGDALHPFGLAPRRYETHLHLLGLEVLGR